MNGVVHRGVITGTGIVSFTGEVLQWGLILNWLNYADDPKRSIAAEYISGWPRFEGFAFDYDDTPGSGRLSYPGDPDYKEIGRAYTKDHIVFLFPHSWVCVVEQATGKFETARID